MRSDTLAERTLSALKKEYVLVGRTHIRVWHLWLVMGVLIGVVAGIAFVANRSGRFSFSFAASSYDASFITQTSLPAAMQPGQRADVSVTMKNTGTRTWTVGSNYRLGSQNPQDNSLWGFGRVDLPVSSVAPGSQVIFTFTVTAPSAPGTYNFQWRMLRESVRWFGAYTPNVQVTVSPVQVSGTIKVFATKDGVAWDSPAFTDNTTFPSGVSENIVVDPPRDFPGSLVGTYTINSVIPPPGVTFSSITPSASQTLSSGGTIIFTFNFITTQQTVTISRTPVTSPTSPYKVGDATIISSSNPPSIFTSDLTGTGYNQIGGNTPRTFTFSTFALRDGGNCNVSTGRCVIPGNWDASSLACPAGVSGVQQMKEWYIIGGYTSNTVTWYFECSGIIFPKSSTPLLPIGFTATYKGGGQLWAASRIDNQTIIFQRWTDPLSSSDTVWRSRSQDGLVISESSSELHYRGVNLYTDGVPADTFGSVDGTYDIWITTAGIYVARSGNMHPSSLTASRIGYGNNPALFSRQWCGYQTICNKVYTRDLWAGWPLWELLLQKENSDEVAAILLSPFGRIAEVASKNFENIQGHFVKQGTSQQYRGYTPSSCTAWTIELGLCTNGALYAGVGGSVRFSEQNGAFQWWAEANGDNIPSCAEFGMLGASYPATAVAPHGVALPIQSRTAPTRAEATWFSSTEGSCVQSQTFRASGDFSSVQGHKNWWYLTSSGAQMTFDFMNNRWKGNETYPPLLWSIGGHPSNVDAVRRWVAPQIGSIRITGNVRDGDIGGGDGVNVAIRKNGVILWQQVIANGNTTGFDYDVTALVSAGDALDFVINKIRNDQYDSTVFDPTILFTSGS